jgi:hypothetical protein
MRVYVVTMLTHVGACVAKTWISYRCVPCHPWCTHRTSLSKKKTFSVFLWLWTTVTAINVCNHGEHYETPCIYILKRRWHNPVPVSFTTSFIFLAAGKTEPSHTIGLNTDKNRGCGVQGYHTLQFWWRLPTFRWNLLQVIRWFNYTGSGLTETLADTYEIVRCVIKEDCDINHCTLIICQHMGIMCFAILANFKHCGCDRFLALLNAPVQCSLST